MKAPKRRCAATVKAGARQRITRPARLAAQRGVRRHGPAEPAQRAGDRAGEGKTCNLWRVRRRMDARGVARPRQGFEVATCRSCVDAFQRIQIALR